MRPSQLLGRPGHGRDVSPVSDVPKLGILIEEGMAA
jgi:hypothetical protein